MEPPLPRGAPASTAPVPQLEAGGEEGEIALLELGGGKRATKTSATKVRSPGPSPPQRTQPSAPRWSLPRPRSPCRRGQQSPWGRGQRGIPWLGWLLPTLAPGGLSRLVLRAASPPAVLPDCLAGGPREGAAAWPANVGQISGSGQKKEPKHNLSSARAHTDAQPSPWAAGGGGWLVLVDTGALATETGMRPPPEVDGAGRNCLAWEDVVPWPVTAPGKSSLSTGGGQSRGLGEGWGARASALQSPGTSALLGAGDRPAALGPLSWERCPRERGRGGPGTSPPPRLSPAQGRRCPGAGPQRVGFSDVNRNKYFINIILNY